MWEHPRSLILALLPSIDLPEVFHDISFPEIEVEVHEDVVVVVFRVVRDLKLGKGLQEVQAVVLLHPTLADPTTIIRVVIDLC